MEVDLSSLEAGVIVDDSFVSNVLRMYTMGRTQITCFRFNAAAKITDDTFLSLAQFSPDALIDINENNLNNSSSSSNSPPIPGKIIAEVNVANNTFAYHLLQLVRREFPDFQLTCGSLGTLISLINSFYHSVVHTVLHLPENPVLARNANIMDVRDIQTAVKLLMPGELCIHALKEGTKTLYEDHQSRQNLFVMMHRKIMCQPWPRIRAIRLNPNYDDGAVVYFAGIAEYLATEIIEVSSVLARENQPLLGAGGAKKTTITTQFIYDAIYRDEELFKLFPNVKSFCTVDPNFEQQRQRERESRRKPAPPHNSLYDLVVQTLKLAIPDVIEVFIQQEALESLAQYHALWDQDFTVLEEIIVKMSVLCDHRKTLGGNAISLLFDDVRYALKVLHGIDAVLPPSFAHPPFKPEVTQVLECVKKFGARTDEIQRLDTLNALPIRVSSAANQFGLLERKNGTITTFDSVNVLSLFFLAKNGIPFDAATLIAALENENRRGRNGITVDVVDSDLETALMTAAEYGNVEVVKILLQAGASINEAVTYIPGTINYPLNNDISPLVYAIVNMHTSVVRALVEAGADVNKPVWIGPMACVCSPMQFAAQRGLEEVVKILLDHGAKFMEAYYVREGGLSLELATTNNHIGVVRLLLTSPDPGLPKQVPSSIRWAAKYGFQDILEELLRFDMQNKYSMLHARLEILDLNSSTSNNNNNSSSNNNTAGPSNRLPILHH